MKRILILFMVVSLLAIGGTVLAGSVSDGGSGITLNFPEDMTDCTPEFVITTTGVPNTFTTQYTIFRQDGSGWVPVDSGGSVGDLNVTYSPEALAPDSTQTFKVEVKVFNAQGVLKLTLTGQWTVTCEGEEPPECEWHGETAWAASGHTPGSLRYTPRGNWATYVQHAEKTVTLFAGQHMPAGTVHFSAVTDGQVTITISLNEGWRLQGWSEGVKIQGYDSAPSGNPAPGQFTTYKGNDLTVTVPAFAFYGVHLDVEWLTTNCED